VGITGRHPDEDGWRRTWRCGTLDQAGYRTAGEVSSAVGERYDALEPFYPDRVAQRILGMGDVLSLIEEVQSKVDQQEAEEQLKKLQKNEFTLDDFRSQLRQVKKLGSFSKIMKLLPDQLLGGIGMPQLDEEQSKMMEKELKRTEAMIDSMTWEERNDHRILNANRRRRIARGSGSDSCRR
jgi:signal recognition particle subunit SRP54